MGSRDVSGQDSETMKKLFLCKRFGKRGGLMASPMGSGSIDPVSSPGRGHCLVFLCKTLYSYSASLHHLYPIQEE